MGIEFSRWERAWITPPPHINLHNADSFEYNGCFLYGFTRCFKCLQFLGSGIILAFSKHGEHHGNHLDWTDRFVQNQTVHDASTNISQVAYCHHPCLVHCRPYTSWRLLVVILQRNMTILSFLNENERKIRWVLTVIKAYNPITAHLKEHVALDRSSWSLKSICNRL